MRPPANDNEMVSPGFDGLDKSSEGSKIVHLCSPFDDLAQYSSMNQLSLLFAPRGVSRDVEPDLKDVRDCHLVYMDRTTKH